MENAMIDPVAIKALAAGLCMGLGAIGAGIGEGIVSAKALEGTARNPELGGKLFTNAIIFMAICESTAIYSLVVALIILFAL